MRVSIAVVVCSFIATVASAQAPAPGHPSAPPSIEERASGLRKIEGYFPLYWDERAGTMLLEIPRVDVEFLMTTGLSAGLGSNDIGLDRGQSGQSRLVTFTRVGPRVLLVQFNVTFRSTSTNTAERKSVEESFAKSVLWGFTVAAESNGRVLVDATDFFLRDVHGAAGALRPGPYRVDRARSAFYLPGTRGFPTNTEVDVTLTFAIDSMGDRGGGGPVQGPQPIGPPVPAGPVGRGGGPYAGTVGSVTPSVDAVTLREHVSFVELPDANFERRPFDPRAGTIPSTFIDYSAPIGEPMEARSIQRHRLQKRTPGDAPSEPVKPIEYWVDPGAPEDVKQALIEGALWWNQAFEAAGFRNALKVAVLPPGADPMDIRYNMINWVHRSTRGWSSGASTVDPRTGEIIKATVTLGSLRDRQDYLIFEGLLSPYANGSERPEVLYRTALARIRQLSAHEVGHTLGLAHNYYNSTRGWISVMDYPHPLEELRPDGSIDLANAYPQRIGEWDKVAITYAYRELPAGTNGKPALTRIVDDAWAEDLRFFTNQDLGVHPRVDQWSNGVDPAAELRRLMKVRRSALDRMGEATIRPGASMTTIEEPLVPIYMYHRYAVEAAAASLGGQDFVYAMRGDGQTPTRWETAAKQRQALDALAATLAPAELTIPRRLLSLIPPRPFTYGIHRELFPRTTGQAFDPVSPATIAADVTIGFMLEPDRAARLVAQHALDPALPGLEDVVDRLAAATFGATAPTPYEAEVRRATERVFVDRLSWLAVAAGNPQVRAVASLKLQRLAARWRTAGAAKSDADVALHTQLAADVRRLLERPAEAFKALPAAPAPPGAPIGDEAPDWLARPAYAISPER